MSEPYFQCVCGERFERFEDTKATAYLAEGHETLWEWACPKCGIVYHKKVICKEID